MTTGLTISQIDGRIGTKKLLLHDLRNDCGTCHNYERSREVLVSQIERLQAQLAELDETFLNRPLAISKAEKELADLEAALVLAKNQKQIDEFQKLQAQLQEASNAIANT